MSAENHNTIAFFGATGGCSLAALARTLLSDSPTYQCRALARTPDKLTKMLGDHGVPESTIHARLTIVAGDARNADAVRETLTISAPQPRMVEKVLSGLGNATPIWRFHPYPFNLADPTICREAMRTILSAIYAIQQNQRQRAMQMDVPFITSISTTGISDHSRDVPIGFWLFYHWLLHVPHVDKRLMESQLARADNVEFAIVRASFMQNGPAKPIDEIRVGWEMPNGVEEKGQKAPGPAVGYFIQRESVGLWLFERMLKDPEAAKAWGGRCVTITE